MNEPKRECQSFDWHSREVGFLFILIVGIVESANIDVFL